MGLSPIPLIDFSYLEPSTLSPDSITASGDNPLGTDSAMSILSNGSNNSSLLMSQLNALNNQYTQPTTPALPSSPSLPGQTSATQASTSSVSNTGSGILGSAWAAAKTALGFGTITNAQVENIVFVVVGLILIIAGVFSFKATQQIAVNVGNAAKTAAEVSA